MTYLNKKDYFYNLPENLIAQTPLQKRDHSKMMVIDKATKTIEHREFFNLIEYLEPGDALVLNDTRVMPARLYCSRLGKEEKIELLLLNQQNDTWECLVKPGKKLKLGTEIYVSDILTGKVIDISENGSRYIKFKFEGIWEEILDKLGEMPLPPYIHEKLEDKERYQTVYSKNTGSSAAPTAGLHFTKEFIKKLENKGIQIIYLTLHVGLGTFRPVKTENILEHHMHSEYYKLDEINAEKLNNTKAKGKKIYAVGTTVTRTLESIFKKYGKILPDSAMTDIFIYPGFEFKVIDGLITNFHLPESTLLMLVSAFYERDEILKAYREAIDKNYRFFSFGDCMFIK